MRQVREVNDSKDMFFFGSVIEPWKKKPVLSIHLKLICIPTCKHCIHAVFESAFYNESGSAFYNESGFGSSPCFITYQMTQGRELWSPIYCLIALSVSPCSFQCFSLRQLERCLSLGTHNFFLVYLGFFFHGSALLVLGFFFCFFCLSANFFAFFPLFICLFFFLR